mmetsp:Transcript_36018/g.71353  ORF Transcript_36018/g.71353 Transcript_36018/m.71353 type:complete len:230 (+) Transcript_36018:853-1542(+)
MCATHLSWLRMAAPKARACPRTADLTRRARRTRKGGVAWRAFTRFSSSCPGSTRRSAASISKAATRCSVCPAWGTAVAGCFRAPILPKPHFLLPVTAAATKTASTRAKPLKPSPPPPLRRAQLQLRSLGLFRLWCLPQRPSAPTTTIFAFPPMRARPQTHFKASGSRKEAPCSWGAGPMWTQRSNGRSTAPEEAILWCCESRAPTPTTLTFGVSRGAAVASSAACRPSS